MYIYYFIIILLLYYYKNMNNIVYCLLILLTIIFIMIILNNNLFYITEKYKNEKQYNSNLKYNIPYNIFLYWDNLENNDVIQYFINNIQRKFQNTPWKVFFITRKTVHEYVDQHFYNKFIKLNSVRFSDFLRVKLLYDYGGVWLDASTIVIQPIFLDNFRNKIMKKKCDVLLFEFKSHTIDKRFPYLENWFIMAPKHSIFIKDLYDYFEQSYNMGFYKFKKNILMKSNVNLSNTIKYGKKTYHMQHAIIHYILLKHRNKYNICIENASQSMFKAHNKVSWNNQELINYINNNNNWKNYYAIKLIGNNRKGINNKNKKKFIMKLNTI